MANVVIKIISDVSSLLSGTKESAERMVALRGEILKVEAELKKLKGGNGGVIDVKALTETENKLKSLRSEFSTAQKGQAAFAGGSNAVAGGLLKGAGVIGLAIGAFSGLKSIVADSVKAYGESEAAQKSLSVALGGTSKALNDQANEIQKTTLFQDDAVTAAQATLAQYKLNQEQIEKLIPSLADFAQAQGIGLEEAAKIAAKAIQGGTNALGKYGVTLDGAAGSNERLGSAIDGLNDKFKDQAASAALVGTGPLTQLSNQFNDLEENVGAFVVNLTGPFISGLSDLVGALSDAIAPAASATEQFNEQLDAVIELEDSINPLLERYKELSVQTNLSTAEHEELNSIIQKLGNEIPQAAIGFDAYGKAIGISADEVERYLEGQRLVLKEKNADAIEEQTDALTDAQENLAEANDKLGGTFQGINEKFIRNNGILEKVITTYSRGGAVFQETVQVSADEIRDLTALQAKSTAEIANANAELDKLTGDAEDRRRKELSFNKKVEEGKVEAVKKTTSAIKQELKVQGFEAEGLNKKLEDLTKERDAVEIELKGAKEAGKDVTELQEKFDKLSGQVVTITVATEVITSRESVQKDVDDAKAKVKAAQERGASNTVLKKTVDDLAKAEKELANVSTEEGIDREIATDRIDREADQRKKLIDAVDAQSKAVQLARSQYDLEIAIIKDFEQKKLITVTQAEEQILKQTEILAQKRLDAATALATSDNNITESEKKRIVQLEESVKLAQQETEAFTIQAHAVEQVAEVTKILNEQQSKTKFEGIKIQIDEDFVQNITKEIEDITVKINETQTKIKLGIDDGGLLEKEQQVNVALLSRLEILKANRQQELSISEFTKNVVNVKQQEVEIDTLRVKSLTELAEKEKEVSDQVTAGTISQEEAAVQMNSIKAAGITLGVKEGETITHAVAVSEEKLAVDQNSLENAESILAVKKGLLAAEQAIVSAGKRTLDQSIQQKALEELAKQDGPVGIAAKEQLVILKPKFDLDNLQAELEATKKKLDLLTTERAQEEQALLSAKTEEEQVKIRAQLDETQKKIDETADQAIKKQGEVIVAAGTGTSPLARLFHITDDEAQTIKDAQTTAALDIVDSVSSAIEQAVAEANARRLELSLSAIDDRAEAELATEQSRADKGIITQEGFENRKKAIEEKAEKERTEAKKKAFESDKRLRAAQAFIEFGLQLVRIQSGAAALGPIVGPPVALAQSIAAGVAFAANLILITSQKFKKGGVVPKLEDGGNIVAGKTTDGSGGGFVKGPSHEAGGVPFQVQGIPMEMEGGEFVVRKEAVEHYGVDMISNINKMMFAQGGSTIPSKKQKNPGVTSSEETTVLIKKVENKFQTGGLVGHVFDSGGIIPSDAAALVATTFQSQFGNQQQLNRESNDESIANLATKGDRDDQPIIVEVSEVTQSQSRLARSRARVAYGGGTITSS